MTIDSALQQIRRLVPVPGQDADVQNVNKLHDESLTLGQRIADSVAHNMGSWRFIIVQSVILLIWITANAVFAIHEYLIFGLNVKAWDPYPFILLNLALSFQAAYAAPFIMMSQNRQSDKDRLAAEHDYHVNIRSEARISAVLEHLKAQDDVILAILRNMESLSGFTPSAAQEKAERQLQKVRRAEEQLVEQVVHEEEAEAGLEEPPPA